MNHLKFLVLLVAVQLCFGGSCESDYPFLNSSVIFSGSFSLTNQYVAGYAYVYYYLSATAGKYYSVTMSPVSNDLDLLGSKASLTTTPTTSNYTFYPYLGGTAAETFAFTAASTECFVIGVYGFLDNSGFFSLVVSESASAPTSAPTSSPPSAPSYQSYCQTLLGDSSLDYIYDQSGQYETIEAGQYSYFYYSAYNNEKVFITLSSYGSAYVTDADVDLYVADASVNRNPTVFNYTDSSATPGQVVEKIQVSSGASQKCFAIGVYGQTSGSYRLSVSSISEGGVSLSLILGLGIGLPVGLCCVLPISIALFCVYGLRPRSRVLRPGSAVGKSPTIKGEVPSPGALAEVDLDTVPPAYTS